MLKHETGISPEFDERREIWRLLKHAKPAQRIAWLRWCCSQVSEPSATTYVEASTGGVSEVWHDAMSLVWGSALSLHRAGEQLVKIVRGRG